MSETDRADLNRRAAELAGWTFRVQPSTGALGITVYTATYTEPGGHVHAIGIGPDESVQRAALETHPPDFLADPALWWPLVERFSRLQGYERLGYEWEGPCFKPEHRYLTAEGYPLGTVCWYVYTVADGRRQWHCAEEPGEAVVRAALYVAEALGLGPEGGADDAD
jgi:hypothetical protein